jgi:hypothetical protein
MKVYHSRTVIVNAEQVTESDWYTQHIRGKEESVYAFKGDYKVSYQWGDIEYIPKAEFEDRYICNQ